MVMLLDGGLITSAAVYYDVTTSESHLKTIIKRSCTENGDDLYACRESRGACDACVFCFYDSLMRGSNGKCLSQEFVNSSYCIDSYNETVTENICCPYPIYCNATSSAAAVKGGIIGLFFSLAMVIFGK